MDTTTFKPLPPRPDMEQFKKQAEDLAKQTKPHAVAAARLKLAREHGFQSWAKFARHVATLAQADSPIARFERAAESIVDGDIETLRALLGGHPALIRARSTRLHRATLLHYVSANGFESYRQRSPSNAPAIAKLLLDSGAKVDALADSYGKSTTLGLVASSVHPQKAGVQIQLLQTLLDHGASVSGVASATSPLIAALHNGKREAAEFLASRGANQNLEGAAGVGNLPVVQSFFRETGKLKRTATRRQMQLGFLWACEYGRTKVIQFLLRNGADPANDAATGLTALHWAIVGGSLRAVQLLLARDASTGAVNKYGGDAIGQALWSASNSDPAIDYLAIVEALLKAGSTIKDDWQRHRISELKNGNR